MENRLTVAVGGNHNLHQNFHAMKHSYNPDEMQQLMDDIDSKARHSGRHSFVSNHSAMSAFLLHRSLSPNTVYSSMDRKSRRYLFHTLHHDLDEHHEDEDHHHHSDSEHSHSLHTDHSHHSGHSQHSFEFVVGPNERGIETIHVNMESAQTKTPQIVVTTADTTSSGSAITAISRSRSAHRLRFEPRSSLKEFEKVKSMRMLATSPILFSETLVEDAVSKEAEIEMREEIKRELKMHYENEKEQIKVDAHAEIDAIKLEYEEENAKLKDDLAELQQKEYERDLHMAELLECKRKLWEMEKKLEEDMENEKSNTATDSWFAGFYSRLC